MRALVMDGCEPAPAGTTGPLASVWDAMEERGWQVETLHLWEMDIALCAGCFGCWVRTPGECVVADAARDVASAFMWFEARKQGAHRRIGARPYAPVMGDGRE